VGQPDQAFGDVPGATGDFAVITVKVGDNRDLRDNSVEPVSGVKLDLYAGESTTPGNRITESWGQCWSDAQGDCSFRVPQTGPNQANRDKRFWIIQDTSVVPNGYYSDPNVVTSTNGSTFASTQYRVRTGGQLRGGTIYSSANQFMSGATTPYTSSGIWPVSRTNPPYPNSCGLDVALLLDLSGSVADSRAEQNLRDAAKKLTASLMGTPSQVALFSFGSLAPAKNGTANIPNRGLPDNQNRPLTPVSTEEGVNLVNGWIENMNPPTPHEATNWDRGLYQIAQSASKFDVAIVLTDGNPTRFGPFASGAAAPLGTGIQTRFVEIEHAIFSANALKAKETRIVAVGVGDGVASAGYNLAAISGQATGNTANPLLNDYYQTGWEEAGDVLGSIAKQGCKGTVTIVKQIVPEGANDTNSAMPAGGWEFTLTPSTGNVSSGTITTAVGTGAASATFSGVGAAGATLRVTETDVPGYTIFPDGGQRAVCNRIEGATPVDVPVTNEVNGNEFTIPLTAEAAISCTVYNKPTTTAPASVKVKKKWVIQQVDDETGSPVALEKRYNEGEQPPEFSAGLKMNVSGVPGPSSYSGLSWDTEYGGLASDSSLVLEEDPAIAYPPGCDVVSAQVTGEGLGVPSLTPKEESLDSYSPTLAGGLNTFEITNTVACSTELTLVKMVHNFLKDPELWILTAARPTDSDVLEGPSGKPSTIVLGLNNITADVTPGAVYTLSESGGDPAFQPLTAPPGTGDAPAQGSVGSWICYRMTRSPTPADPEVFDPSRIDGWLSEGLHGSITVPWGGHVVCIAINYTSILKVTKTVTGPNPPPDTSWSFTLAPQGGPANLPTEKGTVKDLEQVLMAPDQNYILSEDPGGPPGYALREIRCTWDDQANPTQEATFQAPATLNFPHGTEAECEVINDPVTEVALTKANTLTGGVAPTAAGGTFDYVITVENKGTNPAWNVEVSDAVPAAFRVVNATLPAAPPSAPPAEVWSNDSNGNDVKFTIGKLNPGTVEIHVTVELVAPMAESAGPVDNRACVKATNDVDQTNNCGTSRVVPPVPGDPQSGPSVPADGSTPPPSGTAPPGTTPPPGGTTPPGANTPPPPGGTNPPGDDDDDAAAGAGGDDDGDGGKGIAATGFAGLPTVGSSALLALVTGFLLLAVTRSRIRRFQT
jgi:uncharacterized repeat protein (TIGR01451 family)